MTRFEYFESGQALIAARLGVIPVDLLTKYDSYRTYRDFLTEGHDPAKARIMASKQCRCHYSSIVRAIYWFERDGPNNTDLRVRSWRSRKHLRIDEKQQAV